MLRRVENVHVSHRAGMFTKRGPVNIHVGSKAYVVYVKVSTQDYQDWLNASLDYPICFGRVGERSYWLFQNRWHWENDGLTDAQVHALLVTRDQRNQARIDRAQSMVAMQQSPIASPRGVIPDDLKQWVWARDGGQCRKCGSNTELQFDHIIPVSFGGASAAENLQILCGPCNRRKGASVV